jgi:hypothetical protein
MLRLSSFYEPSKQKNSFSQICSDPQTIPYGITLTQATAGLLLVFTVGGACNAGRAFLMRMSGESPKPFSEARPSISSQVNE